MFPQWQNNLTNKANKSSVGNFLINIGILLLTIEIVKINQRNAQHTARMAQTLEEINQNIKIKKEGN